MTERQKPAFVWCELVCRECSNTSQGQFTRGATPRRWLVSAAKERGWLFKHQESFCGAECLRDFEQNVNIQPVNN